MVFHTILLTLHILTSSPDYCLYQQRRKHKTLRHFPYISAKLKYFHLSINSRININPPAGPVQSSLMQALRRSFSPGTWRSIAVLLFGLAHIVSVVKATQKLTHRGTAYSSFCASVIRRCALWS